MKEYLEKSLPDYCKVIQKRLEENSSKRYIVGDKMTIADFDNAHVAYDYFYNETNPMQAQLLAVTKKYPVLTEYYEALGVELKDHLANRFGPRPF